MTQIALQDVPEGVLRLVVLSRPPARWPSKERSWLTARGWLVEEDVGHVLTAEGRKQVDGIDRAWSRLIGGIDFESARPLLPKVRSAKQAIRLVIPEKTLRDRYWLGQGDLPESDVRCWMCTGRELFLCPTRPKLRLPKTTSDPVEVWKPRVRHMVAEALEAGPREEVHPFAASSPPEYDLRQMTVWLSNGDALPAVSVVLIATLFPSASWYALGGGRNAGMLIAGRKKPEGMLVDAVVAPLVRDQAWMPPRIEIWLEEAAKKRA